MPHDFDRLFSQLEQRAVGFGPFLAEFNRLTTSTNYPPHNLIQVSDDEIILELAVAGFKKDEIVMEEHEGLVTIKGEKKDSSERDYRHRGIAARSFIQNFRLYNYFKVGSAILEDGILTVKFIRDIPETAKPKIIAIK